MLHTVPFPRVINVQVLTFKRFVIITLTEKLPLMSFVGNTFIPSVGNRHQKTHTCCKTALNLNVYLVKFPQKILPANFSVSLN